MRSIADKYSLVPGMGVVVFDPVTLTAVSLGATAIGGAASAAGTLAGGSIAKQAGQLQKQESEFQAGQLDENAKQAVAAGQRTMMDTQLRTKFAVGTSTTRAAAGGFNAGTGSNATNVGNLAQRGSYQALLDLFNGQSKATGLQNEAAGVRYSGDIAELEGEEKQNASYLSAAGTLAGSAGSMASSYGKINYPTARGPGGVSL